MRPPRCTPPARVRWMAWHGDSRLGEVCVQSARQAAAHRRACKRALPTRPCAGAQYEPPREKGEELLQRRLLSWLAHAGARWRRRRLRQAAGGSDAEGVWFMDPSANPPAGLSGVFVYGKLRC